jgi:hypothetical protein
MVAFFTSLFGGMGTKRYVTWKYWSATVPKFLER